MKKILFTILGLIIIGVCDVKSQVRKIHLRDTIIIIERLTLTEAGDRVVDRIKSAQLANMVSTGWRADDFGTSDKRLEKDYERIIAGLKKKGIKFKVLTTSEFNDHWNARTESAVYLTIDFTVREEKNLLVITRTFRLLTADKKLLLDEPAKGILMQVSGS